MKKNEKLAYLIHNHFDLFVETHLRAYNELSEKQEVFCCCGRVATYSHEVHCNKFGEKVENETIKRLSHLLPKDKDKPRFKVSNWIVDNCGYVWKIKRIQNKFYLLKDTEATESRPTMEWVDDTFHLWTIQDAKDGDVISFYSEYKGHKMFQIGIIEKYVGKYGGCSNTFKIYVGVNWDSNLQIGKYMGCSVIHPATKEQRDALMKAINNAGYEWDAEKKELKKKR